jgi:hypothetical protein
MKPGHRNSNEEVSVRKGILGGFDIAIEIGAPREAQK